MPTEGDENTTVDDNDVVVVDHPTDGRDQTHTAKDSGKGALLIVTLILSVVVIALLIGVIWVKLSAKAAGKGGKLQSSAGVANRGKPARVFYGSNDEEQ